MKIRNSIIFMFLILFCISNIYSQENRWIKYFTNENQTCYYDNETALRDTNSSAIVWVKVEYVSPEYDIKVDKYKTKVLIRFILECYRTQIGILSSATYYNDGSNKTYTNDVVVKDVVIPETMGEALFNQFCK